MGLFGLLFSPFTLPVKGAVAVIGKLNDAIEDDYYDPHQIKQQLERLSAQVDAGTLSEDAYDELEVSLLERLRVGLGRIRRE